MEQFVPRLLSLGFWVIGLFFLVDDKAGDTDARNGLVPLHSRRRVGWPHSFEERVFLRKYLRNAITSGKGERPRWRSVAAPSLGMAILVAVGTLSGTAIGPDGPQSHFRVGQTVRRMFRRSLLEPRIRRFRPRNGVG